MDWDTERVDTLLAQGVFVVLVLDVLALWLHPEPVTVAAVIIATAGYTMATQFRELFKPPAKRQ
jgi:dolichol kinase